MPDIREPNITIDGQTLTTAQAMTLRVAMSSFLMELRSDDEHRAQLGAIADLYIEHGAAVERMLVGR